MGLGMQRKTTSAVARSVAAGIVVLAAGSCLALSEEEYLKYIEAEASRLSESSGTVRSDKENTAVGTGKKTAQLTHAEFGALLKEKHKGTYSFYESLLDKDKAEVYKAFSSGASMREIRRMIINRKLHR
ncbi:hypothetical protein [Thiolapillus sp.]